MTREGNGGIERRLKSLTLKTASPGLRERVLKGAAKHKKEAAWTTPLLRWSLAACAAILALIFITDTALSRRQQDRLQAFMDGAPRMQDRAADENRVLAEVLGEPVGRKLFAQDGRIAAEERGTGQARRGELLKELLKEDFDGNESQKSSH